DRARIRELVRSPDDEDRGARLVGQPPREAPEALDRPPLVGSAGAWIEHDETVARLEADPHQKLADARVRRLVGRQRELDRAGASAERLDEREITVDDVPRHRRRRDALVREQRVQALSTVRRAEADPEWRPRGGRDHAAL